MRLSLSLPILLAALSGCSATLTDDQDETWGGASYDREAEGHPVGEEGAKLAGDTSTLQTQARFLVERTEHLDDGSIHAQSAAQFVRARAADMPALSGILTGSDESRQVQNGCSWVGKGERGMLYQQPNAAAELLDVGEVRLAVGDRQFGLVRRAFPGLGGVVSGIMYTSRDGSARLIPAVGYRFIAHGWTLSGDDTTSVMAPARPSGIVLNGVALRIPRYSSANRESQDLQSDNPRPASLPREGADVSRVDSHGSRNVPVVPVDAGHGIELTWDVPSDVRSDDLIQVEVEARDAIQQLRCTFRDIGIAHIPGAFTQPQGLVSATIRRIRLRRMTTARRRKVRFRFDFAVRRTVLLGLTDGDGS